MNNEPRRIPNREIARRFTRNAATLLKAAATGVLTADSTDDESYVARCRIVDREVGVSVILTREVGHMHSELPIPMGERVLHLSIACHAHRPPFAAYETLREECFRGIPPEDVVVCLPRSDVGTSAGVIHFFAVCDEQWQLIGRPEWARETAENETQRIVASVRRMAMS
jgi:hypothetical protein